MEIMCNLMQEDSHCRSLHSPTIIAVAVRCAASGQCMCVRRCLRAATATKWLYTTTTIHPDFGVLALCKRICLNNPRLAAEEESFVHQEYHRNGELPYAAQELADHAFASIQSLLQRHNKGTA